MQKRMMMIRQMQKCFNMGGCLIHSVDQMEGKSHVVGGNPQKFKRVFDQHWKPLTTNMPILVVNLWDLEATQGIP